MRPAEEMLVNLGISEPEDIDIAAIADCEGVAIQYRPLAKCDAQIIGYKDRAIVYVRSDMRPTRKRFSGGHELGHWHHHRGLSFVCRSSDIGQPVDVKSRDAERLADAYAADLVLPPFMVAPRLEKMGDLSLDGIADLANTFSSSLTATAIRAVRMTRQPLLLIVHNWFGRRWQWPSITFDNIRARDDLDARTSALMALVSGKITNPKKEPASYWFDRRHIEQFDVRVQSARTIEGECLTLLRALDPKMLQIYG